MPGVLCLIGYLDQAVQRACGDEPRAFLDEQQRAHWPGVQLQRHLLMLQYQALYCLVGLYQELNCIEFETATKNKERIKSHQHTHKFITFAGDTNSTSIQYV